MQQQVIGLQTTLRELSFNKFPYCVKTSYKLFWVEDLTPDASAFLSQMGCYASEPWVKPVIGNDATQEGGIRNWFALTEALCCLMACLWDMLDKTYALKYTHTPPWWVKGIQEVSQSLMQELRVLLSLIPAWRESIKTEWCHQFREVQDCQSKFTVHAFQVNVCAYF